MGLLKKLFGSKEPPSTQQTVSGSSIEHAVVVGELSVTWGKLVKPAKCLGEVKNATDGRAALLEAASVVERVDPKLSVLYRQAAEMMSDDDIVPICHRSAGTLQQQAVLLGKAAQKLGGF